MTSPDTSSILTCPSCGHIESVEIPVHEKQHFFRCNHCNLVLISKPDECCIFCCYGSTPCFGAQRRLAAGSDQSQTLRITLTEKMVCNPTSKNIRT